MSKHGSRKTTRLERRVLQIRDRILAPDGPGYFSGRYKTALRDTLFCVFECADALKRYGVARSPKGRDAAAFDLCLAIKAMDDDQDRILFMGSRIPGVRARVRTSSTLRGLIREHRVLRHELEDPATGDERRVSVLLDLVLVQYLLRGYLERG